jgi:outer membrane protein OmpA-like peptidoglycan-associated protein
MATECLQSTTKVSTSHTTVGGTMLLQRKCACGGSAGFLGECDDCNNNGLTLQRSALNSLESPNLGAVPPIVEDVLRSPGQPLDRDTRAFFEPRLGHDFNQVRIHADGSAAESARSIDALAYTVGPHVVFGREQYAPRTTRGVELIAHELVHVIQQQGSGGENLSASSLAIGEHGDQFELEADQIAQAISAEAATGSTITGSAAPSPRMVQPRTGRLMISRWEACSPPEQCPAREPGELDRARAARLQVGTPAGTSTSVVVSPFAVGSADASSLNSDPDWATFVSSISSQNNTWEILGFTDCEGGVESNMDLRERRARHVRNLLPASARAKVASFTGAPLADCMASDSSEEGRALNRSVVFRITTTSIEFPEEPEEPVLGVTCPPSSTAAVTTLSDYVALLLCAEGRAGLSQREMLTLFRQLYYGKPWSSVSTTDLWDNVIRCAPNVGYPEPLLGNNLYQALRNSPEVEGVDVGHVFTGLEAMTCPTQRVEFFAGLGAVEMSNEEFATWGGDLGAAAAAQVACPQLGPAAASTDDCGRRAGAHPLSFYLGVHAPDQDLEGDIDSYVLRAQLLGVPCAGSARQTFTPTRPMSEVFSQYYIEESSSLGQAHVNRYRCLLQAIGANVQGDRITNVSSIHDPIAGRVASFGEAFWIKIKGGGVGNAAGQDTGDRINIFMNAQRATDWFLDWVTSKL